jgi:uncharacterized protein YggE
MIRTAATVTAFLLAAAPAALAQDRDARFAATTLDVSASGEVKAAPDQAIVTLGVTTSAPNAARALSLNAQKMTAVIAAVKSAGIADKDIQTSNLNLSPQYAYDQGQPPRLTGYEASNQVTVVQRDLTRLGALADAVTAAGATNINGINFSLSHPVEAENAARDAAVKALQDKAKVLADASGYRIIRLVSLREGSVQSVTPRPMVMGGFAAKAAAPTPVETGELSVHIDVSGEFELAK